jgi:hypothetical protein
LDNDTGQWTKSKNWMALTVKYHFQNHIKCITNLDGILWSKDIRKERKLKICNALIKISVLYGSETWRLIENNRRRVEATEMDALRRSSRTSRKERTRNVTIRRTNYKRN